MPIYAYRCAECGHARDVLQKISDPVLTDCPACGAARFEKQLTAAGFQLKGSGWYVTDFRNNNGQAGSGSAGAGTKTEGGTTTTEGGGSKPDAPAAAAAPAKSDGGGTQSAAASAPTASAGCGGPCACH